MTRSLARWRAPARLAAAAAALCLNTLSCGAEGAANLPEPGSYALARIQRAPDARLLGADGKEAALSAYAGGAITALGFFYGQCADPAGCPVAWSVFETARQAADDDPLLKGRLRLVFVSLDPARDTPAALRLLQEAERGSGATPWLFLTSRSDTALSPLLRAMGQDIARDPQSGVIDHMLKVFLIDPEGWVREIYSTAFLTPDSLLNDARTLALAFPAARAELR